MVVDEEERVWRRRGPRRLRKCIRSRRKPGKLATHPVRERQREGLCEWAGGGWMIGPEIRIACARGCGGAGAGQRNEAVVDDLSTTGLVQITTKHFRMRIYCMKRG